MVHRSELHHPTGRYRCLTSLYGIDVDSENVLETRERLRDIALQHAGEYSNVSSDNSGFRSAVDAILNTNIIRADALADAQKIELVAYQPGPDGTFVREWSNLQDPKPQLDLFEMLPGESQKDAIPIHYAELSSHPNPTVANRRKR
jgi:hypothetical protein